jgi:hypothetical protein
MISIICSSIKLCSTDDVVSVLNNEISLKEGKSLIIVRQKKPVRFNIETSLSAGGFRKDFTMQSLLPLPEANMFYKFKKSLILQLQSSTGEIYVIGSTEFPVRAEFSGDNNLVTVSFKQSQPG